LISGWFKRYENNPVVFYQHKSNSENPDMLIGTSTIRVENNQLIGVVRFEKLRSILLLKRFGKNTSGTLRAEASEQTHVQRWEKKEQVKT
jgi:hypothetical protein